VLAFASQASLSIVQWGGGALAPALQERFDLSAAGIGALLGATSAGNAAALVLAGGVIDRSGPRRPLMLGGVACGGLLIAGGLAGGLPALAVLLALSGVAGALVSVAGAISVFHGFPVERRGLALGVRQTAISSGGLIAAVLLPTLAALGGVPLALVVCGALTAATALAFGLATPPGPLAAAGGRRRFAPVAVLRTPGMLQVLAVGVLMVTALTCVLTFAVPAARNEGWSAAEASALFAVVSVAAMAARLTWGRIADRGGGTRRRETLRDVGLVASAGALLYWVAEPFGVAPALIAMAVFSFGALGFNGVLYVVAGELAGSDRAGQAVGLTSMALFGGSAIAAVPLGLLADTAGYAALWPAAAIAAGLGVLVAARIPSAA
jgi:sugar phosphate permease